MFNQDQFVAAQKSALDTLFGISAKAYEGLEKFTELNLQAAKTTLGESQEAVLAALSVKDPQQFAALQSSVVKPAAEKFAAYSRHVYNIATVTSADIGKIVEGVAGEAQKNVLAIVDEVARNAPAGSENVVALVKSSVTAASSAFEGVQKAAKQAADVAEANFTAAAETALKAATAAGDRVAA